jgi:sensor histidine kinase regulating citrate/malate metabolism
MTYEEFVKKGTNFYMDMVRLIDIKLINHMEMTSEEKEINGYILQFQEETKINELRDKFQKCLELEE